MVKRKSHVKHTGVAASEHTENKKIGQIKKILTGMEKHNRAKIRRSKR